MKYLDLEATTKSVAKGRNGYFKPKTVSVFLWERNQTDEPEYHVSIESKRPGHGSPIVLDLTDADMRALCSFLNEALKQQ